MNLRAVLVAVYRSDDGALGDFLSVLDVDLSKFTVESEEFPVLHKDAVAVTRNHDNLFDDTFKYAEDLALGRCRYVHSVVEWQSHAFDSRMRVGAEAFYYHTFLDRPRYIAFVALERTAQFGAFRSLCVRF